MSVDISRFSPPFGTALGFEFESEPDVQADGSVTIRTPWAEHLVGDPDTGVVHGGVITAMLDNACGRAVHAARERAGGDDEGAIATLDLRIDYMSGAEPQRDIYANARCYRMTRNIAFVSGSAYTDSPDEPIATCVGAFMLGTRSEPRQEPTGPAGT
ncbi:MAG: PaaI family thioesterase [Pseudomonadaceae bacterium]|nr:PaaI family thioesterase [Pseudomonadaceae bacterium]